MGATVGELCVSTELCDCTFSVEVLISKDSESVFIR